MDVALIAKTEDAVRVCASAAHCCQNATQKFPQEFTPAENRGEDRGMDNNTEQKPKCQEPVEVYSRVCGFFRPVKQWNKGKQEEFRERRVFRPL